MSKEPQPILSSLGHSEIPPGFSLSTVKVSYQRYICLSTFMKNESEIYASPISDPEKAMAPHSSTVAWEIPWMDEPGRLQSMGSLRVGHD